VVAVCCLFLSSTIYLLLNKNESAVEKQLIYINSVSAATGVGELKTLKLPDGTIVTLNSMSTLIYPNEFCGKTREVVLIGEGFFDVAKNKDMPFIVKTDKMNVEALGTSFEVSSYKYDDDVSVILKSGLIKVSSPASSSKYVVVEPNHKAVISAGSDDIDITSVFAENMVSWKDGILVFDDTPLPDILKSVSKRFGVEIFCNQHKYSATKITATILKEMSLEESMKVLSEIGHFRYSQSGKQYIIK
ncbi:MAG: DUF4974 domain-containing protein, partial [Rikenellaceae bacterium]